MDKAIEKRQSKNKELILELLRKTPIVQAVCERSNISRASYYRWRIADPEFAKACDQALFDGSLLVNDLAENQLISAIKDKNLGAIRFWLVNHHPAYANKVEITASNKHQEVALTEEQKELLNKALEMATLIPPQEKDNE